MSKITKAETYLAAQDYSSVSVWSKTIHGRTLFPEPSVSVQVTPYDRRSAGGGRNVKKLYKVCQHDVAPAQSRSPEARLCIKVNLNWLD